MNYCQDSVLTHCVSQPACLHSRTPFDEWLRTNPHKQPFSASASCCRTLLRFDCPDSSRVSERILVADGWFTSSTFTVCFSHPPSTIPLSCNSYSSYVSELLLCQS